MKIVYFTHSLVSCWNHGNAHFLRGVLRDLVLRGHEVVVYEPQDSWSLSSLLRDHGDEALNAFRSAYGELRSFPYESSAVPLEGLDDADVVIVHEWNEPTLVAAIGRRRSAGGRFKLFFHDTHHRAVSNPDEMRQFDLEGYDAVLAFGEALAEVYRGWGWGQRVYVWHEAADTRLFCPPAHEPDRKGLVWIGNWGDGERSAEIETYLLKPAEQTAAPLDIYGVRYPNHALDTLRRHGASYHGWAPNAMVPAIFARHLATIHIPRRFYVEQLPGIPTIRVFEALACGIPLICAPWHDSEHLFRPGEDYLVANSGAEMARHLRFLSLDVSLRRALSESGLAAIKSRHTCTHRASELLAIVGAMNAPARSLTDAPAQRKAPA